VPVFCYAPYTNYRVKGGSSNNGPDLHALWCAYRGMSTVSLFHCFTVLVCPIERILFSNGIKLGLPDSITALMVSHG